MMNHLYVFGFILKNIELECRVYDWVKAVVVSTMTKENKKQNELEIEFKLITRFIDANFSTIIVLLRW